MPKYEVSLFAEYWATVEAADESEAIYKAVDEFRDSARPEVNYVERIDEAEAEADYHDCVQDGCQG